MSAERRELVVQALARYGVTAEIADVVTVPERTRRRAVFKIAKNGDATVVGFHAPGSHTVVDMTDSPLLTPALMALVPRLRATMNTLFAGGQHAEAHVTQADNGIDIAFRASTKLTPALTAALAKAASGLKAIRIVWNGALAYESAVPVIRFGKADVKIPAETFLQPTREGETALRERVVAAMKGAKTIADLFCGCGTFSLPLAEHARVHAVEREAAMLAALAAAARGASGLKPVTTEKRDLFKLPVTARELVRFDGVVLDPPRVGAQAQAHELAASQVGRIAYVSCDAQSFARDARILIDASYKIGAITPVDQFLWSSHIELVAAFTRR